MFRWSLTPDHICYQQKSMFHCQVHLCSQPLHLPFLKVEYDIIDCAKYCFYKLWFLVDFEKIFQNNMLKLWETVFFSVMVMRIQINSFVFTNRMAWDEYRYSREKIHVYCFLTCKSMFSTEWIRTHPIRPMGWSREHEVVMVDLDNLR